MRSDVEMHSYRCPVCGFDELDEPPYDEYGDASFDICPCCGVEFGYHDATTTHAQLRDNWIKNGCPWTSTVDTPPADWNPYDQLQRLQSNENASGNK